jgi:hypothetical protein
MEKETLAYAEGVGPRAEDFGAASGNAAKLSISRRAIAKVENRFKSCQTTPVAANATGATVTVIGASVANDSIAVIPRQRSNSLTC